MESTPATAPVQPAPIMDVAPPPKNDTAVEAALAQPPAEDVGLPDGQAKDIGKAAVAATAPVQKSAPAKPKPASTKPTLAITLAVTFFVVLSALAFYAYIKTN